MVTTMAADEAVVGSSKVRDLEKRARELERRSGRKTLETEIVKEALEPVRSTIQNRGEPDAGLSRR